LFPYFFSVLFSRSYLPYFFSRIFSPVLFPVIVSRNFCFRICFPYLFSSTPPPPYLFPLTFLFPYYFLVLIPMSRRFKMSVSCFSRTCRYNTGHVPCGIFIQTSPVGLSLEGWGVRMPDLKGQKMNLFNPKEDWNVL
jgi:hypothetical protein